METLQELAKEIIKKYDESGIIEHDTKHFSVRSANQVKWSESVWKHGISYRVIRSLEEFKIFVGQVFGKGGS